MTTATMTLTEFLLARIAEDEASIEGDWAGGDGGLHIISTPMHERMDRECEAKRRIVERHSACGSGIGYCDDGGHGLEADEGGPGCGDLFDLVAVYADHPDYREEWRP